MQEIRDNWKIMFSGEEKERVEKEGRQDDEDTEINDEEQNIEEDIAVTEVDVGLRWDLNYEPAMDRRSEFSSSPSFASALCLSRVPVSMYLSVSFCFLSVFLSVSLFLFQAYLTTGIRPPLDICYG